MCVCVCVQVGVSGGVSRGVCTPPGLRGRPPPPSEQKESQKLVKQECIPVGCVPCICGWNYIHFNFAPFSHSFKYF